MNILWLTWKDLDHPRAGGAELINEGLAKCLAEDGHSITFIVHRFKIAEAGLSPAQTERSGFQIIRTGSRFTVYWKAFRYYKKHLQGWPDIIIDEINTVPFFASLYTKEKVILFIHQLAREIWYYQTNYPLSYLGYMLEPVYLKILNHIPVITVSNSTKEDLARFGFKKEKIHIIPEAINIAPLPSKDGRVSWPAKYPHLTLLSLGAIRPMKRVHFIIQAFNQMKKKAGAVPRGRPTVGARFIAPSKTAQSSTSNLSDSPAQSNLSDLSLPAKTAASTDSTQIKTAKLIVAGAPEGIYGARIKQLIANSPYKEDITFLGEISHEKKIELLQKCHVLCVTPVKEGWGLTVTEAASQGTPAVGFDVDGICDAIRHGETGIICKTPSPECLADNVASLLLDQKKYARLREQAWRWSREFTFDRSYETFKSIITSP